MELSVQKRGKLGRGVKALRNDGLVPAELYGRGLENLHLSVPLKEFRKVFKAAGENTVVQVLLEGKKHPVLIQDVSYDPVTDEMQSVDLYQVRMDEKLKVKVPMEFVGVAPAVKEKNGLLVKALQELEVEALPVDLPHHLTVDISKLADIGQSIYVKDLAVPAGVKVLVNPETVVVTATAKVTEEEELAMQQAATAGVEGLKVETEEKKAEREAGKAATGEAATPAAEAKSAPAKEASKTTAKEQSKK
ncbi:MAG: 50S ribosomal protein L25 [Candidatus Harrisonbacteria bacterium]|nr:50S ribosomal protein L25 [Candidatus Harrisonbacteria bacterium]